MISSSCSLLVVLFCISILNFAYVSGIHSIVPRSTRLNRLQDLHSFIVNDNENENLPVENKLAIAVSSDILLFSEGVLSWYVLANAAILVYGKGPKYLRFQNLIVLLIFRLINIYTDLNNFKMTLNDDPKVNVSSIPALITNFTFNHRESHNLAYILHSPVFQFSPWPLIFQTLPFMIRWLSLYLLAVLPYEDPTYVKYKPLVSRLLGLQSLQSDEAIENANKNATTTTGSSTATSAILARHESVDDIAYAVSVLSQGYLVVSNLFVLIYRGGSKNIQGWQALLLILYIFFLKEYFLIIFRDTSLAKIHQLLKTSSVKDAVESAFKKVSSLIGNPKATSKRSSKKSKSTKKAKRKATSSAAQVKP
jgi:hypothetical protein